MGACMSTANVATENEIQKTQRHVGDRLKNGLAKVKGLLEAEMNDPTMMQKILDIFNHFLFSKVQDKKFVEFLSYTLVGPHLTREAKYKLPRRVGKAVFQLTDGAKLARASNVCENFLDCEWVFEKMQEAVNQEEDLRDCDEAVEPLYDISMDMPEYMSGGAALHAVPAVGEVGNDLKRDMEEMLSVLEPLYDLLSHLPPKFLEEKKMGILAEQHRMLKMRVGSAVLAIKVCDASESTRRKPVRAAFVGPESIGKSTVINHLVSEGRGDPFMHVAEGMGTEMICIVSDGIRERLQLGTHGQAISCNVQEALREQSEKMASGKSMLSSLEALRATKPFNPPFNVELIDVPGIKTEKQLESALALSIASVLVICLGPLENAKGHLKGDLRLLPPIVQNLERHLPIVCLVTRSVDQDTFERTKEEYRALLQNFFPGSKIDVLWSNFLAMSSREQKQRTVDNFYHTVGKHSPLESNPYKVFLALEPQLRDFTKKLALGLNTALADYFSMFADRMETLVKPELRNYRKSIEEEFNKIPLGSELDKLQLDAESMPCFSLMLNGRTASEVSDEAHYAQELLFESRIATVKWLLKQGAQLHERAVDEPLNSICELSCPKLKDEDNDKWKHEAKMTVCDKVCQTIACRQPPPADAKAPKCMEWWQAVCCNPLGKYLRYSTFPWIVTGFYLITVDERMKFELLSRFLKNKGPKPELFGMMPGQGAPDWVCEWKRKLVQEMSNVTYKAWVKKCKSHKEVNMVYNEIFASMEKASRVYEHIILDLSIVDNWNDCIKHLLEVTFVMVQRLLVVKPAQDEIRYSSFAEHLLKHAKRMRELEETLRKMETMDTQQVAALCPTALDLMRESNGERMEEWKRKISEMEGNLPEIASLNHSVGNEEYRECGENVMLLSGQFATSEDPELTTSLAVWDRFSDVGWSPADDTLSGLLNAALAKGMKNFYLRQSKDGDAYEELTAKDIVSIALPNESEETRIFQVRFERSADGSSQEAELIQVKLSDVDTSQIASGDDAGGMGPLLRALTRSVSGTQALLAAKAQSDQELPCEEPEVSSSQSSGERLRLRQLGVQLPASCPEHVVAAVRRVTTSTCYPIHTPTIKAEDEPSFARNAMREIRQRGSTVVVYVRDTSIYSHDPIGIEKPFLEALAKEPRISACFVLWCPQDGGQREWRSERTMARWQKPAGDVAIHLKPLCSTEDVSKFTEDLFFEVKESKNVGRERMEQKEGKLREKTKAFTREVQKFFAARAKDIQGSREFQQYLRKDVREKQGQFLSDFKAEAGRALGNGKTAFEVPSGDFLSSQPSFMAGALDQVDGDNALNINEVKCRDFLFNVMLGQTVDKAAVLASLAYDTVMGPVLHEVGRWFHMDGKVMLEELNTFCNCKNPSKAADNEELLRDFLSKDNFVNMYVGCVLSAAVPMLYVSVLPTLWDSTQGGIGGIGEVTESVYMHNFQKTKALLEI